MQPPGSLPDKRFRASLREDVPLNSFTTLDIGGPARFFAEVTDAQILAAGVRWAREQRLPLLILGGGSNLLISDEGFPGLVIRIAIRGMRARVQDQAATITCGAGEVWDEFVQFAVDANFAGIECLSGIPGQVGATPIQNVGAYGQEISQTMINLEALDPVSGEMVTLDAAECGFSYRSSRFKRTPAEGFVITSVTYALSVNAEPVIRYRELQNYLTETVRGKPSLAEVREAVLALRRRKSMVVDKLDENSRSAGSFFTNPVVSMDHFERIAAQLKLLAAAPEAIPAFPAPPKGMKISAGWLIEQAGFSKGFSAGRVGLSANHALAIVNRGGATAREVRDFARTIQNTVFDRFGIALTPEPVFVGL